MKTLRLCGWAVIFTATFLLAACASHDPQMVNSDVMSGPDTTMSQTVNQMDEGSAIVVSQDWLDERERAVEQRELDVQRRENAMTSEDSAIFVSNDWLDERERAVEQRELEQGRREHALVVQQAWNRERELQLDLKEFDLERQGNSLAIQQAWSRERDMRLDQKEFDLKSQADSLAVQQASLNERETRLAQGVPDLTHQREILAFKEAWLDEREMLVEKMENYATGSVKLAGADATFVKSSSSTGTVKLAGADATFVKAGPSKTKIESGHCYASVVFPAEYKTVAVVKPIEVPKGENLPTLYQTVTEKVKVTDEQSRWEEILCEDRMTECRIIEIQRALTRGGYNPGPIDGVVGQQTMAAVNAFQKDFNLTVANHLTIETVKALDANF